jgi:simple sugar transport system substrate-binding protein
MHRRKFLEIGTAGLIATVAGCRSAEPESAFTKPVNKKIVLGFSQVGAEGGWRLANTKSIKEAAPLANVQLRFADAEGKQENQISHIQSFIDERVDVIAFSPIVEQGWDQVLNRAKAAGVPVVLTDRLIDSPDTSLYTSSIGADFIAEGNLAALYLAQDYADRGTQVNIVEIQGAPGAAPTKQRTEGFLEAIARKPRMRLVDKEPGDWTQASGAKAMRKLLDRRSDIDAVFAQNDDMGLGAAEVLEKEGLKPGTDVRLVTVDATKAGMTALAAGRLNYIVECSPLIGRQLMDVVVDIYLGGSVSKRVLSEKIVFDRRMAQEVLPDRVY